MLTKIGLSTFFSRLKRVKKKYPQSSKLIDETINSLTTNHEQGDLYPGFGELRVRKLRFGLPEYKLSKRDGLRLLHLYISEKSMVIPLTIYSKKGFGKEQEVLAQIKTALKEALNEIDS
jgi:hypothetical protein